MRRLLVPLAILAFAVAPSLAQTPSAYKNDDLASKGIHLADQIAHAVGSGRSRPIAQIRRDVAQSLQDEDGAKALETAASALGPTPNDASLWLFYAQTADKAAQLPDAESQELNDSALAAAYLSYEKAARPADRAAALAEIGAVYARGETWRPSLDAYRASLALMNDANVRKIYEAERAEHGFRIIDYKVDSDSTSPRVCFQFSESLVNGKIDYAPYVVVSGATDIAISAKDQELCVDGLEHGKHYSIVLREGLPSTVDENLLKSADYDVYVRDRAPQVRFTARNYVLPRVGQDGIPIVSVNTNKAAIDILRIGDRNLLSKLQGDDFLSQIGAYETKQLIDKDGVKIWSGSLDVKGELNKEAVTAFPVLDAVGKMQPGVYVMVARAGDKPVSALKEGDDEGLTATQWFVVSDIGLTALSGDDGMLVLARSLASATPLAGVEVRLIAHNNEVLATKTTDATGAAHFDPGLARGVGGMAPALLAARGADDDYNFLDLSATAFDLSDRGVKGRVAPHALDAFVYAERGVYRSGETVDLTALLRSSDGSAVAGLPLTLVVKRPDGVDYKRSLVGDQGLGGRAFSFPLLAGAQTGTWRVEAFADPKSPAIGSTSFLVEDYTPERMELKLAAEQSTLRPSDAAAIDVDVRYLYGAPGGGLDISGDVTVQQAADASLPGYPGFIAGLQDQSFEPVKADLPAGFKTDDKGHGVMRAPLPDFAATRPIEAKFTIGAAEPGGRAIERTLTLPIQPKAGQIGVKNDFSSLNEGSNAQFEAIVIGADGKRASRKGLHWSLYRIVNDYQWYNSNGRWNFERVQSTRRMADGTFDAAIDSPAKFSAPVGFGKHRLDIKSDDPNDAPTSIVFEVGWGGDASAQTPDLLDVTLDKTDYRPGDRMVAHISSRFSGAATLLVSGAKVDAVQEIDLKVGDNEAYLPVGSDWGAGAYLVAIGHRPLDVAGKHMPGRAIGLAWFGIDSAARKLAVTIEAPAKVEPRRPLSTPIKLVGLAPGEDALVTVAAVDVGILNLTGYQTPDPTAYFFGQRQLSTEVRDLYGLLIDGMQGARGAIHTGGDEGGPDLASEKPTQEPLSLYSGVVKVGPDGVANVTFDIPSFNGSMRIIAVAWSKTRVGSAQADVVVRDPVVVAPTLPHFLALGDQSRLFLQLDNVEGPSGYYAVDLNLRGPLSAPDAARHQTLRLETGQRASLNVPINASAIGEGAIDVKLTGPGVSTMQSLALSVEPPTVDLDRRSVIQAAPGDAVTISQALLSDFVPGTGSVSVAASPIVAIDAPALLQALDRYPFGCSEQVVSRAMPLLYLAKLGGLATSPIGADVADKIRSAIDQEMARQDSNGAFGLWSSSVDEDDLWLDSYVTDFLTRARESGYDSPQRGFAQALDHLRNSVENAESSLSKNQGDVIAYAIYVLARNGRPVIGDLRYLADTKIDAFDSPLARAQLAAALALLGDRARAETVFASAAARLSAVKQSAASRPDYGSRLRDSAGLLVLASESGLDGSELTPIGAALNQERAATSYLSTQEEAWMTLAAEEMSARPGALAFTVDGAQRTGAFYQTWKDEALKTHDVAIRNDGTAPVALAVTVSGYPSAPEPPASHGYAIKRGYYGMDGKPIDPKAIHQNDRFVVVLEVTESAAAYARLMLQDRLPAGLEVDNPDLFDGASTEALSWIKGTIKPTHTEYRNDRFIAAFDRKGEDSATFDVAYIVRAVTPGHYLLPPATIEDMYRPERFGATAYDSIDIGTKP